MSRVVVFQQTSHEPLGLLDDVFAAFGLTVQVIPLYKAVPDAVDWMGTLGLVVLGGPMNVDETDTYPFLKREVQWIREALASQVPILGICLGSQLLAKALGAAIYPNRTKEIGWYEINLTEQAAEDLLFLGLPASLIVFQWHGDTFDLPKGAVLLATSPQCRNQAFRMGDNAWGLQFHPEMTTDLIDRWLSLPGNAQDLSEFPPDHAQSVRSHNVVMMRHYRAWNTTVLERFAEICTRRKATSL